MKTITIIIIIYASFDFSELDFFNEKVFFSFVFIARVALLEPQLVSIVLRKGVALLEPRFDFIILIKIDFFWA